MKIVCIVIILAPLASVAYADVIYDDQTYDYDETYTGLSIWGGPGYETADDFEVEGYWTLELVRVWFTYHGEHDIRVDIFSNGPDDEPGSLPPGDLYYEEVPSGNITWTDTGDVMYGVPFYQVDIPIDGFPIEPATRYWLGLQSISGDNSSFWLNMKDYGPPAWWETLNFYHSGSWHEYHGPFHTEFWGCEFELHGTPDDTTVEAGSFGAIKALYR